MCYADNTDSNVLQELLFGIDFVYKMYYSMDLFMVIIPYEIHKIPKF